MNCMLSQPSLDLTASAITSGAFVFISPVLGSNIILFHASFAFLESPDISVVYFARSLPLSPNFLLASPALAKASSNDSPYRPISASAFSRHSL